MLKGHNYNRTESIEENFQIDKLENVLSFEQFIEQV